MVYTEEFEGAEDIEESIEEVIDRTRRGLVKPSAPVVLQ